MVTIFLISLAIFLFGICWGSFLHGTAFRIAFDNPLFRSRSHCPSCDALIAWYDNLPVVSWLVLKGVCRSCKKAISSMYLIAELVVGFLFVALFYTVFGYDLISVIALHGFHSSLNEIVIQQTIFFLVYVLLISNLIIATITDLYVMAIPQLVTLWMVPVGLTCAYFQLLPITLAESMSGAIFGYGFLWLVALLFRFMRNKDGMGVGDMEIMAMIGSFLGVKGAFATIMCASLTGSLIGGLFLMMAKKEFDVKIPFAPFLSLGALLSIFFQEWIHYFFFGL